MEPEIKAMSEIAAALKGLDPDAVHRVLKWANEFHLKIPLSVRPLAATSPEFSADSGSVNLSRFAEIHELFDAAHPVTGLDKVLVAAYWYEVIMKHEDLDSQELNKSLKHLGYQSSNITRDLDNLINRSPRLVIQVRKEGRHKQARRRYKLTREGIRAVERMLTNPQSPSKEQS